MPLTTGDFPPVDPATFTQMPYRERLRTLSRHWAEYGFGAPKITMVIYIAKLLFFYVLGGALVATLTSGLDPLHPAAWWDDVVVYQKAVLWTVLLECIGVAGSWGPLAGHFKPMTGGIRYWARPRTIRLPPWPDTVPGTRGDARTRGDVALYLALLASVVVALALPTVTTASIVPIIALLVVVGLRDKIIFIAARGEQYLPALVFFAFYPVVDMIVAAKLLIVVVWTGAAFSKFGRHFANVIPPMVSNTPWMFVKAIKRAHYRDFPRDLRPSERAVGLAHVGGTFVEFVTPLVLLFSHNPTVTVVAAVVMIGFHLFIISTFPLAVPLEWNALFIYITAFLFLGHPNHEGFGLGDMDPVLLVVTVVGLVFFPVLGNLRPDLVSFLPSMRQYAGNWASAMWAMAPGAEAKLDERLIKGAPMQKAQLSEIYGAEAAEVVMQQTLGWRSMHSQGRGLNSVMMTTLGDDIDHYTLREAEFSCNAIVGFNFGDGHLHDRRLIEAIQKRCEFAPGEFIVVWVESEPVGNGRQQYLVIDAAVGIVERGSWAVTDAVAEQPWLPDGPIRTQVEFRLAGYQRASHAAKALVKA
ncbi:DUF3556 domain-containing protein [Solirubrobacter ginsenosidimutans]|uniref:DUF3556 domain-containing protein n=1 Tax=Solirubrobacter ginsenosidimutans TaxID=490573 RepID=A0A9X3MPA0_9ACTN|nr:DUF3556 domain-containing protein [Solirubrobacter ginsenosidimutans]MDA0159897.1 DUF3556 domain-containing protein [Solirubrobacter ginsenosidimutans]